MRLLKNKILIKILPCLLLLFFGVIFFKDSLINNKVFIAADTIVGMYHPWRDSLKDKYPAGVPFRNYLITDSVRQQFPWKFLAIEMLKKGEKPLWNPYNFSGTPLLANFQSAVFYPLNILFVIFPFVDAWQLLISSQVILGLLFMYFYLKEGEKLNILPSLTGAVLFSFSGFSMAWLEWGNIFSTALWLPLILLATKKISLLAQKPIRANLVWMVVLVLCLCGSLFAGHLQTFFYLMITWLIYLIVFIFKSQMKLKLFFSLLLVVLIFLLLSYSQWGPTLTFISQSSRHFDQTDWQKLGWFIPWQNLIQFFVPDFFGNPATLNYWGVFNYGEFIGYIGVASLILITNAILTKAKKPMLYFLIGIFCLSLALPTPWGKLVYLLKIPLISTSQPTRLLFLVDFMFALTAAYGLDQLLKKKINIFSVIVPAVGYLILQIYVFLINAGLLATNQAGLDFQVSQRNMILPLGLFIITSFLFILAKYTSLRKEILAGLFILLCCGDLFRFGWKYNTITDRGWLYPPTEAIKFLQQDKELFRIQPIDQRIMPPNFNAIYKIQSVGGYDPLFLLRYAQIVAASERGESNIQPPFGFNRIISPEKFDSRIIDLLNVKYILSLNELQSDKLEFVFSEGQTKIYFNKSYFPRFFLVNRTVKVSSDQEAIEQLFDQGNDLRSVAIVGNDIAISDSPLNEDDNVELVSYEENKVKLSANCDQNRFLVLTDSYYPGWKAYIDGNATEIYLTNYNFRGVICPTGLHQITFEID